MTNNYILGFLISFMSTILMYLIFPLILRLTRNEPFDKKRANKIAILNSAIVAILFFLFRELDGTEINNKINIPAAFLYYSINLGLLKMKLKEKNYTYTFMLFSFISLLGGYFVLGIILGIVAFFFAYGGLLEYKKKYSWQRIVLYIEEFLGLLYIFLSLISLFNITHYSTLWGLCCTVISFILIFIINHRTIKLEKKEKAELKIVFCKKCGGKLDFNKACTKCGKKYFKFNYKILSIVLFIVIILISSIAIYYQINYKNLLKVQNEYNKNTEILIDDLRRQINILTFGRSTWWTKNKLDFFDDKIVFEISGHRGYYTYDCMVDNMNGNYTFLAYNKEQAISLGLRPGKC